MEVCLEQNVDMDPLSDVATVAHVTRYGIENVRGLIDTSLHCEPGREVGHVVDAWYSCSDLLLDLVRAEVAVVIEKLRQVRSHNISWRESTKQCGGSDGATNLGSAEI